MPQITPFLWFEDQAEEAATFYTSLFSNSKLGEISRYGEAGPRPAGTAMTVSFNLEGQEFIALNGGPAFKFNEAISFFINCETQAEVDHLWHKLSEGGQQMDCGWVKDKYGVTWQVIPSVLMELLGDKDPAKSSRVMQAMLQMKKIDIAALQQAHSQS